MTKEFKDASEFVDFLKENETIASILPFAEELVSLHENVEKGCKCRRNQRVATRDHIYKTMIENVMAGNEDLQDTFREYSGITAATWKENNDKILLEI